MDGHEDGVDAMGEAHAPGQAGGDAIAAVSREKAADAPDAVAQCRCGSRQIQHAQAADASPDTLQDQGGDAEDQAAKPGKASRIPEHSPALIAEFRRSIDDVPDFGADDAGDHRECHHPDRVRGDSSTAEVAIQNETGKDCCQPEHESKGRDIKGAKVKVGQHLFKYRRGSGKDDSRRGGIFTSTIFYSAGGSGDTGVMSTTTPGIQVLYTRQQIAERVAAMGAEITRDLKGEKLVMVGVLKGAAPFLADLARAVQADATFDFVAVSSYGKGQRSSGAVKLIKDLDEPVEGKNVLIVEDILDTGLTLSYLRKIILQHHPKTLRIAALLDKPSRRIEKIDADYVGFSIPNLFVIGYGMDYAERYRNLPDICLMTPDHPE